MSFPPSPSFCFTLRRTLPRPTPHHSPTPGPYEAAQSSYARPVQSTCRVAAVRAAVMHVGTRFGGGFRGWFRVKRTTCPLIVFAFPALLFSLYFFFFFCHPIDFRGTAKMAENVCSAVGLFVRTAERIV